MGASWVHILLDMQDFFTVHGVVFGIFVAVIPGCARKAQTRNLKIPGSMLRIALE